jgi:hypothetical protein
MIIPRGAGVQIDEIITEISNCGPWLEIKRL